MRTVIADEWWQMQPYSTILAGLFIATVGYIAATVRKVLRSNQRLEDHVLPHFVPPSDPSQIDVTLPARMARVENSSAEMACDMSDLRRDLVDHMRDETIVTDRIDERLNEAKTERQSLREGQERIERRLDGLGA